MGAAYFLIVNNLFAKIVKDQERCVRHAGAVGCDLGARIY